MGEKKELLTTNRKALTINLDERLYGTFAEIGAGQEVARIFFQAGGASRTAQEVFVAWKDLSQLFRCQEYAKLFVALARSVDLPAFYVHVERDYCNRIVDHDCAVVYAEGKAWLVDPAYAWFGVPHLEFRVLGTAALSREACN